MILQKNESIQQNIKQFRIVQMEQFEPVNYIIVFMFCISLWCSYCRIKDDIIDIYNLWKDIERFVKKSKSHYSYRQYMKRFRRNKKDLSLFQKEASQLIQKENIEQNVIYLTNYR